MSIVDIACIIVVCVAANHLGLIAAIEQTIGREIPIVNCPKCFTFWTTLIYGIDAHADLLPMLAISFLCAWLAIWLELGMGIIDYLYNKVYEKIFVSTADNTTASDPDKGYSADTVPEL